MNMDKSTIRPYYSEFQGYLSQAPTALDSSDIISDESLWNQYNKAVDLLSTKTAIDYSRFKIETSERFIRISTYRQRLGGLISRLHAEYFSDEPAPFSGMPSTIITQTQQQSISVQMLLDIQTKIDEALTKSKDDKEKGFLNKFKSALSSITNVNDLLSLCLKLAKEYGLTIQSLMSFWS